MRKFIYLLVLFFSGNIIFALQGSKEYYNSEILHDHKNLTSNEESINQIPLDFPVLSVKSANPDSGYYFMSNGSLDYYDTIPRFLLILDNYGKPFYYKRLENNAVDFKVQPNGLITYWDMISSKFYAMDSTFTVIDSFYCKNGYNTDPHELLMLPNGHFLLIGDDTAIVNMEQYTTDGNPSALVIGNVIQEQDESRNVVFEWKTLDHFKITDATEDIDLTFYLIDYCHMNAIETDKDGNLLISSRNMDEITKINRQTGDIIWRLGGKNNQFKFINDSVGFSHQHDIRKLSNGDISLFDDGNLHFDILPSRAVEYKLDEINKTVELVWQYVHDPPVNSLIMGNVQQLTNTNRVIGWGSGNIAVTEIDSNKKTLFELNLPVAQYNYRALKYNLNKSYYSSFVPKLNSPANNSRVAVSATILSWKRNKFAQGFHLQVAQDLEFNNLIVDDSLLTDTTYLVHIDSINSLSPNSTYWRVLSYNNSYYTGGYCGYSDIWTFKTESTASINYSGTSDNLDLIQIFPNPADNSTGLTYNINNPSLMEIGLYNELGIQVNNVAHSFMDAGNYSLNIDLNNLAVGTYYLQIKAGPETTVKKLIVIR